MRDSTYSIEAEQAVLGSLMFDNATWHAVAQRLVTADFYRHDHQTIFAGISELAESGKAIDALTLHEHLLCKGVAEKTGGLAYLTGLVRDTPSASNVGAYADVVRERSTFRQLQQIAARIAQGVANTEGRTVSELVADATTRLSQLQQRSRQGAGLIHSRHLTDALVDDLDARRDGPAGLPTGLADFDELTMGLEPGDLVVIAGRPGMGKTALLVEIASHVSQTAPVAVFSAEMPSQQLMRRAVSRLSGVPQGLLRRADRLTDRNWSELAPAIHSVSHLRLHIDDTAAPTLVHIRAEVSALHAREPIGMVIIDYIQLVQSPGANRYESLRTIAYGLKALAKDLRIPIIVLAQLNRGVEARDQKRPSMSDLRDSGAIEEAADIIGLLYSEGYYDPQFSMAYVLECAIAKNRNGERGECLWAFDGAHSRITVLPDGPRAQYRQLRSKQRQGRGGVDL